MPDTSSINHDTNSGYSGALKIITRDAHCISRKNISRGCLKVLYTLNEAGYQAFIVGGGVRDLLLDKHPKDFDVATDATPEQVKAVFRHARIIGRRFRIVHVTMGREIIEVSTFRAANTDSMVIQGDHLSRKVTHIDAAHSDSGMILRDNVYGSLEEDVQRRDFTANALYYTVKDFAVYDFVNGMADVEKRILRMIGDPEQRYREDPVRILRAIRLSAKLDFTIAPETADPIRPLAHLLESIPPARLFDEMMKLFFAGHALATWQLLDEYDVFKYLFPATGDCLAAGRPADKALLQQAFDSTDRRLNDGMSVNPAFLLAAILWPALQARQQELIETGLAPMAAMHEAGQTLVSEQVARLSIPKRFSIPVREIWDFQLRLTRRNRAHHLVRHKRFRAAYDFVLLREAAGEDLEGLGAWWSEYQEADDNQRKTMQDCVPNRRRHSKSRKRRVKSASARQPAAGAAQAKR